AEDGIRDFHVTGVQTCALPIYCSSAPSLPTSTQRSSRMPLRSPTLQYPNVMQIWNTSTMTASAECIAKYLMKIHLKANAMLKNHEVQVIRRSSFPSMNALADTGERTALLSTFSARFGTFPAMIHFRRMHFALLSTGITRRCAQLGECFRMLTSNSHYLCRRPAHNRTLTVQFNTPDKGAHLLILKARTGAIFAHRGTSVTCHNAIETILAVHRD